MSQYDAGSCLYNCTAFTRLKGPLNLPALETAFNQVRERHEMLRTRFESSAGGLLQVVQPFSPIDLPVTDLTSLPCEEREQRAMMLAESATRAPFDLTHPPIRAELVKLQPDEHLLLVALHHTCWDGWSRSVLMRDMGELYEAAVQNRPPDLPAMPIQYSDFAVWQRERVSGEMRDRLMSFWRDELAGVAPLELPSDYPRSMEQTFDGARVRYCMPQELISAVKSFSRARRTTLFTTLAAALQVLLHRHTDQDDLTIGFPVAGRTHVELEPLIGPFINMLVLRADFSGDPTFSEFLERQRQRSLQAIAHQEMPFEHLVQELGVSRDTSRSPLFQVLLQLAHLPQADAQAGGLQWLPIPAPYYPALFDLTIELAEADGGFEARVDYNRNLFAEDTIRRLMRHYEVLLAGIAQDPERRVSELPLLTPAERHQLLVEFNATDHAYPAHLGVHDLFREQAQRTPRAAAASCGDDTLTYEELDQRSEALAARLVDLGVKPDDPVGLHVTRTLDLPVSFMATLKAGGACLPLDPAFPGDRLAFMVEDAGAEVLVSSTGLPPDCVLPDGVKVLVLEPESWKLPPGHPPVRPSFHPDQIAYVTYTSGSTGKPKGVAVPHRGCVSLLSGMREVIYSPEVVAGTLHTTSISFDVGPWLVFVALSMGGCLIIPESLLDLIFRPPKRPVTLIDAVPSALIELLRQGALPKTLHTVILGGECAPGSLVRRLYAAGVQRVINQYGPTETTVVSTSDLLPRECEEHPTIGRAVANTQLYVLDKHRNPVPLGSRGELYIGGVGVARGYLNRPDLMSERFLPDPFRRMPGARMYRTGDFVKYNPDGSLHFLGRADSQVKVRGCRVELEEVQAALQEHPAVQQAGVIVWQEAPGGPTLAAYVALSPAAEATAEDLREHLRQRLPEFMLPSFITFLEALPLRPSGKLDTDALPAPEVTSAKVCVADDGGTRLERQLQGLWAETLEVEQVGLDDSFFTLGGHSLLAARLFARLREQTGYAPPLPLLFRAPTIRRFAQALIAEEGLLDSHCLVPIRPEGQRPSLFCTHHETGEVFCYVLMSKHLTPDRPVYGVRAPEDGLDDPEVTLVSLAKGYVRSLTELQPEGPYHLLGYSQAAKVAYEMARQLRAQGREVGFVGLVDFPVDLEAYRRPRGLLAVSHPLQALADLPFSFAYDRYLTAHERRHEWRNRLRELAMRMGYQPHSEMPDTSNQPERWRRLDAIIRANEPQPYEGDVVVFRSRQQSILCTHDPTMDWNKLVKGRVEVVPVRGIHGR
ncbi:MAG: amino acid adenylation domain-containing protein, partial [Armatimonadia bacterium]